jgi:uncharacterized protein (TIGR02996 family)
MTSDQLGCLAAVLARPDDDLPRLLFSDAAEEAGDAARAEFVRVQCEIAERERRAILERREANGRWPDDWYGYGMGALRRRERELLDDHDAVGHFLGELPGLDTVTAVRDFDGPNGGLTGSWHGGWTKGTDLLFSANLIRGFVAEVRCDWPALRDHFDAIRRAQPVERVVLTSRPVLTFGPIRYEQEEGAHGIELLARWLVTENDSGQPLAYGNRLHLSNATIPGDNWRYREAFDRENDRARTVEGFLRLRWPKTPEFGAAVEFVLPPEPVPYVRAGSRARQGGRMQELRDDIERLVRRELPSEAVVRWVDGGGCAGLEQFEAPHRCRTTTDPIRLRPLYWMGRPPENRWYSGRCERCQMTYLSEAR